VELDKLKLSLDAQHRAKAAKEKERDPGADIHRIQLTLADSPPIKK
jgi:hypothetical protein